MYGEDERGPVRIEKEIGIYRDENLQGSMNRVQVPTSWVEVSNACFEAKK